MGSELYPDRVSQCRAFRPVKPCMCPLVKVSFASAAWDLLRKALLVTMMWLRFDREMLTRKDARLKREYTDYGHQDSAATVSPDRPVKEESSWGYYTIWRKGAPPVTYRGPAPNTKHQDPMAVD